jgi:hypothetical protein
MQVRRECVRCPTSDRHAARLVFQRVSVLIAGYRAGRAVISVLMLQLRMIWSCVPAGQLARACLPWP